MILAAGPRQVRLRVQGGQAHLGAVAADGVPPDGQPVCGQQMHQFARPQAGALRVPLVEAVLDLYLCLPRGARRIIQAAARDGQQFGLPVQWQDAIAFAFHQGQPLTRRQARGQIFFSASSPAS